MKKLFLLLLTVVAFTLSAAAQRTVTGTVVYAGDGEPLAGATILPVGGGNGVATDLDGKFTLTVPAKVTKLNVSYVGMLTQQVEITAGEMKIALTNSENNLDEVMVVAYGTEKKSAFTGSASVVKADALEDRLVSNVTNALAGAVAGVQIQSANGQPGTSATVRVRGVGSLYASNSPLYVLDGIPFDGDIASIAPNDIESMTVLKDAAAAALYGARGANGVILITTKKGKQGDAKVTFDARWGANSRQITNYDVIESGEQYLELMYQALYNSAYYRQGLGAAQAHNYANNNIWKNLGYQTWTVPDGQLLIGTNGKINPNARRGYSDGQYYYTPDDWAEGTFRNGLRQEYNLSISGGTDRFNYYVSANYLEDEGIIDNSAYERLATRASVDYKAKEWLKVGTNMSYTYSASKYPSDQTASGSSGNAFNMANTLAPVLPMYVRNADGSIKIDERFNRPVYDYGDGKSTNFARNYMSMSNPASDLIYNDTQYLSDIFNGKWYVELTPLKGLSVTGSVGYSLDQIRYHDFGNQYYGQSAAYSGTAAQESSRNMGLNLQALANYKTSFNNVHNIDILAGYESYEYTEEYVSANGQGVYQDGNWAVNNTLLAARRGYGAYGEYATRGIIGRVNYNYDTKYYGSVSYRRDASSRFHPDKRWGDFFSVSAAWDAAKESFIKDNATWVDMLKIKASFGQQGNDNLGNGYAYIDQYTIGGTDSWSDGTLAYKGNPELTWEKSNAFNVGADFSLWQGKLAGTVEYFSRQTSDMLYNQPTSPSLGYSSIPVNIGSMRNYGVEIELNYQPITTRNITWDINFNATFINNKIIELAPDLKGEFISGSTIWREGESRYQFYLVQYAGVDPTTGEALYWARTPEQQMNEETGQMENVKDENGKTVYKPGRYATTDYDAAYNTNRQATGDILPTVYGGIGTTLKAYGFDFGLQCSYQLGGKTWDDGYQAFMHSGDARNAGNNWHKDILNAWTPENTNTDVPRLDANDPYAFNANSSNRVLVSSDYFAINNITIGYTLPNRLTKKFGVESLRIYGAADNVALFSARKGLDPRQSYTGATTSTYTAMRCISGGVKLVF